MSATITMSASTPTPEADEIHKGIQRLGLHISESELDELQRGNLISLESRRLSEIGSMLILAEALSAVHSVKSIRFGDLPHVMKGGSGCSGAPIHGWHSPLCGECWLVLTLTDGKPAVRIAFANLANR